MGLLSGIITFAALAGAQPQQSPPPTPPIAPKADLPPIPAPPSNTPIVQPAFSVVIDAAHGGADTGARFSTNPAAGSGGNSLEKDITLALAGRLHSALSAKGIAVVATRQSDIDLPPNQRAGIANHALASACLFLHATATGTGVHLYTSSLTPLAATAQNPASPSASVPASLTLVPWQTAQTAWITRSLRLSSELNSALGEAGIPTTLGVASVTPLDNLNCPAVAIEISPLAASASNKPFLISDPNYQQRLIDAITAAVLDWRSGWKQQP